MTSVPAYSVFCTTLDEVQVAAAALAAYRRREAAAPVEPMNMDPSSARAERIHKALDSVPLNPQRRLLLKCLLAGAPEAWVGYPEIKAAFEETGFDHPQAAAALRDLSWQMGEFLPKDDLVGLERKIEVLAERSRSGGAYAYRLTLAGRTAVERFLEGATPSA